MAKVRGPLCCAGIRECRGSRRVDHSRFKCRDCLHRFPFPGALRAPRGWMGPVLPCEPCQRVLPLPAALAELWCMSYKNKREN